MTVINYNYQGINENAMSLAILNEIARNLNIVFKRAIIPVKEACSKIVGEAIRNSEEYRAMLPDSGRVLYGEIGRPDIESIVEEIIKKIQEEIIVDYIPAVVTNASITISLEVKILELSHQSLFYIPGTSFYTDNGDVHWLQWLLLAGSQNVIFDYTYTDTGSQEQMSRTHTGIMIKSKRGWGIDPRWSGVAGDNWLTRAMDTIEEYVRPIMENNLIIL